MSRKENYLIAAAVPLAALALASACFGAEAGDAAEVEGADTLLGLLIKGGWVMIPLAFCSVLALALTVERFLSLSRRRLTPPHLTEELKNLVVRGGTEEARTYCTENPCPMSNVFLAGLNRADAGIEKMEKAIEDAGAREYSRLKRSIRPLEVIARVAPLLGLLGTVYGMISAFQAASDIETNKAAQLAVGIYEALVTTATGLTLAIPVLIITQILSHRIEKIVDLMDDRVLEFLEYTAYVKPAEEMHGIEREEPKTPAAAATGAENSALQRAIRKVRGNDLREAEELLREIIDAGTDGDDRDQAFYCLGYALKQQGRFREARDHYQTVLTDYPDSRVAPDALYSRGVCEANIDEDGEQKAAATFREFLDRYGEHKLAPTVMLDLAKLDYTARNYESVLDLSRNILQIDSRENLPENVRQQARRLMEWSRIGLEREEEPAEETEPPDDSGSPDRSEPPDDSGSPHAPGANDDRPGESAE